MAQFDVYPHPVEEWRDQSPYVVDIQSDLVRGVRNRLTIPPCGTLSLSGPV